MHYYHGVMGFILLILDLWAIISVLTSYKDVGAKVLWTLLILLLPVLGYILWLFFGPRANRS